MGNAQTQSNRPPVSPLNGWPRELVVEHSDGTCSLYANVDAPDRETIRMRRAGDVFREELR